MRSILHCFLGIVIFSLIFSCKPQYKLQYFRNLKDTGTVKIPSFSYEEIKIKVDDGLTIHITGRNPETSAIINSSTNNASSGAAAGATGGSNFLVDAKGQIEIPLLGVFDVAGKTITEVKTMINTKAKDVLVEPIVTVRFAGFKFTVLGEVKLPSTFVVQNEKVTILQAIGMAGDLTTFAKRENIKIMREVDGKQEIGTIDLASTDIFNSPYYYLKQNDVIYLPPTDQKYKIENGSKVLLPYASLGLSVVTLIITLVQLTK
jgi:polysaccharide biosynthesis/export protein